MTQRHLVIGCATSDAQERLTLEQFGDLVGRPAPYLSLVENGKKEPRLSQIAAFARALEIPMEELLTSEPPNRRAQLEIKLEYAQASLPRLGAPLRPGVRPLAG